MPSQFKHALQSLDQLLLQENVKVRPSAQFIFPKPLEDTKKPQVITVLPPPLPSPPPPPPPVEDPISAESSELDLSRKDRRGWFCGKVSRDEAESLLENNGFDSFLVRDSSHQDCFALSKYSDESFIHYLIVLTPVSF